MFLLLLSPPGLIQTNLGKYCMVCFKSAMTSSWLPRFFVVAGINRRPTIFAGRWIYIIQVMGPGFEPPKIHPIEKEHHLNQTSMTLGFKMLFIFQAKQLHSMKLTAKVFWTCRKRKWIFQPLILRGENY